MIASSSDTSLSFNSSSDTFLFILRYIFVLDLVHRYILVLCLLQRNIFILNLIHSYHFVISSIGLAHNYLIVFFLIFRHLSFLLRQLFVCLLILCLNILISSRIIVWVLFTLVTLKITLEVSNVSVVIISIISSFLNFGLFLSF